MKTIITQYLESVHVGRKQSVKNLALFPLLSDQRIHLDYLTLDEALNQGVIEVKEVDQGGSVPNLAVLNKSPKMILILDGEELVGAKQNRIVNTTILIEGHTTLTIPVSCVEQGRWTYVSDRFVSEERMMSSKLRAKKAAQVKESVRQTGEFRAAQGEIWEDIAAQARRRTVNSPSMAMADIYEKELPVIEEYLKAFTPVTSQVGAVFMINGEIAGLEGFGKPETMATVFTKLVKSYALDAIDWFDPKKEYKLLKGPVTKFLNQALSTTVEMHPSVALGTDYRLESTTLTGFALALNEELLHLSVFTKENENKNHGYSSRMARYSRRKRYNG